jgi:hypothetical protein
LVCLRHVLLVDLAEAEAVCLLFYSDFRAQAVVMVFRLAFLSSLIFEPYL